MLRAVFLWASLVFCCAAQAGGFAIVPLRVELGPNRSSSLTVTNTEEAKTFEVRAVSWKQQNRSDSYAPTDDLLVAPATFRLEKGASQVVRIQLNRPLDAAEHAYRIFVDEVPPAQEVQSRNSLKTVVSMAVPVFVAPASGPIAKGEAAVSVALVKDVLKIEMHNTGKANLKLREWVVTSAKARRTAQGAFGGLRAGRQHADRRVPAEDPG